MHPDFSGSGVSAIDPSLGIIKGRKFGGVGFLWNKRFDTCIKPVHFGYSWLTGLRINLHYNHMYILGVYFPVDKYENIDKYLNYLGILKSVIEELPSAHIMIVGDINTDVKRCNHFSGMLQDFVTDNNLDILDQHLLPENSYTFISDVWNTTSWLDHCITTHSINSLVTNMKVLYEYIASDHKPISVSLKLDVLYTQPLYTSNDISPKINWHDVTDEQMNLY